MVLFVRYCNILQDPFSSQLHHLQLIIVTIFGMSSIGISLSKPLHKAKFLMYKDLAHMVDLKFQNVRAISQGKSGNNFLKFTCKISNVHRIIMKLKF